jgi:hypothetical protein
MVLQNTLLKPAFRPSFIPQSPLTRTSRDQKEEIRNSGNHERKDTRFQFYVITSSVPEFQIETHRDSVHFERNLNGKPPNKRVPRQPSKQYFSAI